MTLAFLPNTTSLSSARHKWMAVRDSHQWESVTLSQAACWGGTPQAMGQPWIQLVWHDMVYFVITEAAFKLPLKAKGTIFDLWNNIFSFSKINIWCLLRLTLIHILLQGKFCNNVTVFVITDNSFVVNYGNSYTNQCCSRESQRRGTREMATVYYCWNISSS